MRRDSEALRGLFEDGVVGAAVRVALEDAAVTQHLRRHGDAVESDVELGAHALEVGALRERDDAHAVELEPERIHERLAALDGEMKMRSGGPPRLSDVSDELPRLDVLPG